MLDEIIEETNKVVDLDTLVSNFIKFSSKEQPMLKQTGNIKSHVTTTTQFFQNI
jgi:hypothetical protein